MSRKNRRKNKQNFNAFPVASADAKGMSSETSVTPPNVAEALHTPNVRPALTQDSSKIRMNAMDVIRAQDAASKAFLTAEVAKVKFPTTDGFDNFISRVGLNNDNTLSGSTYEFNLVSRNRLLLEAAYRGSWIVGVVVDAVADDMTRAGIDITTSDQADLRHFFKNMTKLQIWESLRSLAKWGRLYGGAIGVLQIEGQNLATPLNLETITKNQFKGIVTFDRWMLNPVLTPVINSGPDMGLPAYYQIVTDPQSYDPNAKTATGSILVHHSRCIRYTGIDLPFFQAITEQMWGESILERLWDRLISFDNATMSSASLIDRANLRTVGIQGLREIIAAGGEAQKGLEAMFEMMRFMQTNEGLTLLDKDDEHSSTAYSFAGLSDMMLQFGQQLAGASGIPLVRLFGQSPAGLSSTGDSDIRMYYDSINAQQEAKFRNPMDTLIKVLWRSTYGTPTPDDLEFSFTPLWQMSALDKANVGKTTTETVLGAFEGGLISQKVAVQELRDSSGDSGLYSNITDKDVNDAEEEIEEPPMPDELSVNSPPEEEGEKKEIDKPSDPVKNIDSKGGLSDEAIIPLKPLTRIKRWLSGK